MLAFVHIEKCGGTTLIDVFRRTFVLDHCDVIPRDKQAMLLSPNDLQQLMKLRPSLKSISGHSVRLHAGLDEVCDSLRYLTCLRDPVKRCVSEYRFFYVDLMRNPVKFEDWINRDERRNFQTRAIAGKADVELAKRLLDERFSMVGLLEEFDEFLSALAWLAHDDLGCKLDLRYEVRNSIATRTPSSHPHQFPADYKQQIAEANSLDIELYQHVVNVTLPRQRERLKELGWAANPQLATAGMAQRWNDARKTIQYRLYRNLVYKPSLGYWPGKHALPVYRDERKAS